nr:MAG TPA: hypothetical protein [Bacteriophage sp.]
MSYVRENDSTQNAHIKHSNDSRQKAYMESTETIRHMKDSSICRIMGKEYKTMTNREKFAEQILDIACGGSKIAVNKATLELAPCYKLACKDCLFNFSSVGSCKDARKKWANSEYVEPPVDWSKFAVDTPILVRDNIFSKWVKRYFAKYENGIVYAWSNGTTSWSGRTCTAWVLAKLPERSSNGEIND